jgi:hypothetical protein
MVDKMLSAADNLSVVDEYYLLRLNISGIIYSHHKQILSSQQWYNLI